MSAANDQSKRELEELQQVVIERLRIVGERQALLERIFASLQNVK